MNTFHRIMFATDLTPTSQPALREAVEMAFQNGAELIIVHAYQPPNAVQADAVAPGVYEEWDRNLSVEVAKRLEPLVEEARNAGTKARALALSGAPFKSITESAKKNRVDLIIMGTHGRKGVSRFFLGSVASRVISAAPCPVMTVRAA